MDGRVRTHLVAGDDGPEEASGGIGPRNVPPFTDFTDRMT